ncbi:helix-turn-helix domain-containing protein [Symmachiella dynata]|uniref:helix-turn-helix domain-containing protein n=1 Tax=Symmachiella dynata TaxID=2527995 RepID=UPI00119FF1F4
MKPLLTVEQVSQWLNLSVSKIYQMADAGTLPSLKIDGAIRFAEGDLLAYLESCRRESGPRKQSRPRRFRSKHFD